jgi:hypothetical protein
MLQLQHMRHCSTSLSTSLSDNQPALAQHVESGVLESTGILLPRGGFSPGSEPGIQLERCPVPAVSSRAPATSRPYLLAVPMAYWKYTI